MRYIGVRSSKYLPVNDTDYWGSSKHLPKDIRDTHRKIIIKEHSARKEAVAHEVLLHDLNDVAVSPFYYNKAKQLTTGFDTSGVPMSEEAKAKISRATKGRTFTKEHLANIQAARTENGSIEFTAEHIANLSKAQKAHCAKPGYVNPRKGVIVSAESRRKNSESKKADKRPAYVKAPKFKPWFITDNNVTHLFYTTTKQEYAIQQQVPPATYRDLATRSKGVKPIAKGKYKGLIIGNIRTV